MSASMVPRRKTAPAGRMSTSMVPSYISSAPLSGLGTIHRSGPHHEAENSNSDAQAHMAFLFFPNHAASHSVHGISLFAAFLATLNLASRDFSGIDQRLDAVMWKRPPVAVHAIP